jgi:hypothetical protein
MIAADFTCFPFNYTNFGKLFYLISLTQSTTYRLTEDWKIEENILHLLKDHE